MQFFRNAATAFLTSIALMPIGLLTSILLARLLSVEDLGHYSITLNFASLVMVFSQLGLGPASVYRIRRVGSDPARVLTTTAAMLAAVAVVVVGGSVVFRDRIIDGFLAGAPETVFLLAVANVPFDLVGTVLGSTARSIDRFRLVNTYRLAVALATLAAVGVVLGVLQRGLVELLAAILAVHALGMVLLWGALAREIGFSWRVDRTEVAETARFGIKSYAQAAAGQIHERVDVFMIAYFLNDPAQVAFYAIAVRIVERLRQGPRAIQSSLFPKVAGASPEEAARFTAYVSRQSVLWVALGAVVLVLVAPVLIPLLYGEAYAASVQPFRILVVAMVLLTFYFVLSRYFTAIARQQITITSQVASAAVNIGLNVWLIPRYGILGAAVASLVSYAVQGVLIIWAFTRATRLGVGEVLLPRPGDLRAYRARFGPVWQRLRGTARG